MLTILGYKSASKFLVDFENLQSVPGTRSELMSCGGWGHHKGLVWRFGQSQRWVLFGSGWLVVLESVFLGSE